MMKGINLRMLKLTKDERVKTILVSIFIIIILIALLSIENIERIIIETRCLRKRASYKECRDAKPSKEYKSKFKSLDWIKKNTSFVSYPKIRKQFLYYVAKAVNEYWNTFAKQYPKVKISKKEVVAFIDALARLEQGKVCMFAYNLFGVQGESYWEVPSDAQPDYAFNIIDSGGYCRVFLGWKSMEKSAKFITYVVMRKIFKAINELGEFNPGVVYTCKWWRGKCYGSYEEFTKIDTFNNIYKDSLKAV